MVVVDLANPKARPGDGSHMTARQVDAIQRYFRRLLRLLDLNYWRVYVAKELPPENAHLMIEVTDGRRVALLHVAEDWWAKTDPDEKRTDLTHEALHLIHHDQEEVIRRFKNETGDVSESAMSLIWSQFSIETERMVDSLSYVAAPFMPKWTAK